MACRLAHQALIYSSPDEFAGEMAPLVLSALEAGNPVVAATTGPNIDALRETLGDDAAQVGLEDTTTWCTRPYDRLQEFRRQAAELAPGQTLYAMGEPLWGGSEAMVRQWARYESVINVALADARMRFVCLYDGSSLPDHVLDYAERTHPERVTDGAVRTCAAFTAPEDFVPGAPAVPPPDAAELAVGEMSGFRLAVAEAARRAGLAGQALEDLVLAVNEVATNALRHGRPPLRAHAWADAGEVVVRVADGGRDRLHPTTGWHPPASVGNGGWGLPLARQLCDVVEIASDAAGTAVSLHVAVES